MRLIKYPSKEQWTELLKRPALNTENLFDTVRSIINKVRAEGDKAVLKYEATFDKVTLSALAVTPEEIQVAGTLVSDELKAVISLAKQNIETFHASQRFIGKKVEIFIRLFFLLRNWQVSVKYSRLVVCRLLPLWPMERRVYLKYIRYLVQVINM